MASIRKDIYLDAPPADVWAAVRDVGAVHERLAPGFVVDTVLDGECRVVTFANGIVVRELLVDVDDDIRRVAYSVVDGPLPIRHHHATMEIVPAGDDGSRLVWIADIVPNEAAERVGEMMDIGSAVIADTLRNAVDQRR